MDLLIWAIIALVISVIAGAFGFSGVARGAKTVSKILFGIFLVIAIILFLFLILGINLISEADAYPLIGWHTARLLGA